MLHVTSLGYAHQCTPPHQDMKACHRPVPVPLPITREAAASPFHLLSHSVLLCLCHQAAIDTTTSKSHSGRLEAHRQHPLTTPSLFAHEAATWRCPATGSSGCFCRRVTSPVSHSVCCALVRFSRGKGTTFALVASWPARKT
jgi:hypothetical protein